MEWWRVHHAAEDQRKAMTWDESQHPRDPKGEPTGGQFTSKLNVGSRFERLKQKVKSLSDRLAEKDGGFTYQPVTGDEPKHGFAVSIFEKRGEAIDAHAYKFTDLAHFAAANRDLLKRPGNHLGAWHDPKTDKLFLDVSRVFPVIGDARRLAKEHDQIAIYSLHGGRSITVNEKAKSGGVIP
jgi:hypothetical protein